MKALGLTELRKDKIKSVMRSFQVVVDPKVLDWRGGRTIFINGNRMQRAIKQYFCENYNAERRLSSRLGLSK